MANFKYYLKDVNSESDTPVLLYIRYEGKRLKYYIGESINPKYWNAKEGKARAVSSFPTHKEFNDRLRTWKEDCEKLFLSSCTKLGRFPNPIELKNEIDLEIKKIPETSTTVDESFLGLFQRFIDESENGTRVKRKTNQRFDKRSIQKYNTVKSSLTVFDKSYKLTFERINEKFYTDYLAFLRKKNFSTNNEGKYIQVIKTFMRWATDKGFNTNMFFTSTNFTASKVPGFSIYLNESEIMDIYKKDLSQTPHLERVRDLFIVGCWTGLRFSDFTSIKPENIEGEFLRIKTFKTGETVIIPIHHLVKEIMAKYKNKYPNSLPPAISNQKMNKYLKDIAKEVDSLKTDITAEYERAGLKVTEKRKKHDLVTTHTARRSFATNVYKSGFPAISLMKITGHKTEKAFLLYIKTTPEDNAKRLMDHWRKSILKAV